MDNFVHAGRVNIILVMDSASATLMFCVQFLVDPWPRAWEVWPVGCDRLQFRVHLGRWLRYGRGLWARADLHATKLSLLWVLKACRA